MNTRSDCTCLEAALKLPAALILGMGLDVIELICGRSSLLSSIYSQIQNPEPFIKISDKSGTRMFLIIKNALESLETHGLSSFGPLDTYSLELQFSISYPAKGGFLQPPRPSFIFSCPNELIFFVATGVTPRDKRHFALGGSESFLVPLWLCSQAFFGPGWDLTLVRGSINIIRSSQPRIPTKPSSVVRLIRFLIRWEAEWIPNTPMPISRCKLLSLRC